mmetsp:Transcript_9198/g.23788  ORF Transcript_9198/g.23788 Transcript_9198/m.23788 type:complete len:248 (+) Transcript_9198:28-771(+)
MSNDEQHAFEEDWVSPEAIVHIFEASQFAFLASIGLLLFTTATHDTSRGQHALAGISWKTLQLNLLSAFVRVPFQMMTHFFDHWITGVEIVFSIALLGMLVALLELGMLPAAGPRPTEDFNSLAAIISAFLLASIPGLMHHAGYAPYVSLGTSVFLEVAAVIPQRRLFAMVKRMPALASHSLALLVLSRGLRLVVWALMCLGGAHEWSLLLADAVHVYLLWDFFKEYLRSRGSGTSELIIATRARSM